MSAKLIDLLEAAKILGLAKGSMRTLLESRSLEVVKKKQRRMLLRSEVEALINDEWVMVYRGEAPEGWMFSVDAAKYLKVTFSFIGQLVRIGKLQARKVGRFILVSTEDVESYRKSCPPKRKKKPDFKRRGLILAREAAEMFGVSYRTFRDQILLKGYVKPTTLPDNNHRALYFCRRQIMRALSHPDLRRFTEVVPDDYCTLDEASKVVKVSTTRLARIITERSIPRIVVGRQICIPRSLLVPMKRQMGRLRKIMAGRIAGRIRTTRAIADELGITAEEVRRMRAEGLLRGRKVGTIVAFWPPSQQAKDHAATLRDNRRLRRTGCKDGLFTPKQIRARYKLDILAWNELRRMDCLKPVAVGKTIMYHIPDASTEAEILALRNRRRTLATGRSRGLMTSEAFRIRFGLTSGQQYTARRRGLVQCHNIGKRAYYEEPTAEAARAIRELGRSSRSPRGYIPLNEFRKKHGISSRQGRRLIDAGLLKIRQIDVRQFVGPLSKEAAAEIAEMTAASAIYREGAPAGLITRRELLSLLRITQHQLEQLLEEGLITKSSLRERTLFDPPSETAIARAAELVMLSRASRGLKANGHFTGRQLCKASRAPMTTVRSVLRQLDRLLVTRGRFKLIPADVFEALVYVCKHYPEYGHRRTVDLLKAGKIVGSQLLVLRHEDYGDIKAVSPEGEDPRYVLVEILLLKYRRESGQILLIEKEGRVLTKEQATQMLGFGEHILDAETRSHIFQRSPHPDRPYYEMEILWRKQEMLQ